MKSCARCVLVVDRDVRRKSPLPQKVRSRKPRVVVDTSVLVAGLSGFRELFVSARNPSGLRDLLTVREAV